jgi:hypothetical protein
MQKIAGMLKKLQEFNKTARILRKKVQEYLKKLQES